MNVFYLLRAIQRELNEEQAILMPAFKDLVVI